MIGSGFSVCCAISIELLSRVSSPVSEEFQLFFSVTPAQCRGAKLGQSETRATLADEEGNLPLGVPSAACSPQPLFCSARFWFPLRLDGLGPGFRDEDQRTTFEAEGG